MAKRGRRLGRLMKGLGGPLHTRGLVIWAAALATGVLCVWQHVYSQRLAADIDRLRDSRERLSSEIGFLEMDCARLADRERIEEYATTHLGMRYPTGDEVVRVDAQGEPLTKEREERYVGRDGDDGGES